LDFFFVYLLESNWLLQIEKKTKFTVVRPVKEKSIFPKTNDILNQSAILISRKKVSSTKVRYQKYASNAEKYFKIGQKLCLCEQKYENIGIRRHFGFCGHFVELQNLFLVQHLIINRFASKSYFLEARVSVEILQKNN
jgi:hypothetical protein